MAKQPEFPLIPMDDRICVLPDMPDEKIGSIILPDNAKRIPNRGRVIDVGRGKLSTDGTAYIPPFVSAGQYVWYERYEGHDLEINENGKDVTYKFIREDKIICVERD